MSVVDAEYEKVFGWTEALLLKEQRGPSGSIEDAAFQSEIKYGVPASILMRVWDREPGNMLAKNWLAIKLAYEFACSTVERQAQHQQELAKDAGANAANSRLYKMGVVLGGSHSEASE